MSVLIRVTGVVNGNALANVEKRMDPKRVPIRKMTVKAVRQFVEPIEESHLASIQQVLMWFGVSPKLERILWATRKKNFIKRQRYDESVEGLDLEDIKPTGVTPKKAPPPDPAGNEYELPELTMVCGMCKRCGGTLVGISPRGCEKAKKQSVFYKECRTCTYYAQVWKNKVREKVTYFETEGG